MPLVNKLSTTILAKFATTQAIVVVPKLATYTTNKKGAKAMKQAFAPF
ncbi:MAG: hypothetical protein QM541_02115 [Flavobacterium sp.]|nr:hypothetical protein [Flavobacterium sp.]